MKHCMIRPKVISQQNVHLSTFLEMYNIVTAKKTWQNTSPSMQETEQTLRNHPMAYSLTPKKISAIAKQVKEQTIMLMIFKLFTVKCSQHNCDQYATCIPKNLGLDYPGSHNNNIYRNNYYYCQCNNGYSGNGRRCSLRGNFICILSQYKRRDALDPEFRISAVTGI